MFGCGESGEATFRFSDDASRRLLTPPQMDRLRRADELNQPALDALLAARGRSSAKTWMAGLLALVGGWFAMAAGAGASGGKPERSRGRAHTVPSTDETVRLGVFDATLPAILEIEPGDEVVYTNTWSHFLNRVQPGVPIGAIARMRRENAGVGPHSIVGPIGVRGARPGDMVAIHFERLVPVNWAVNFNNPGDLGTGALPDEFSQGQVRYFELDLASMRTSFRPGITLPVEPFQGTFGVAAREGGIVSSVPPGQHAGNIDLRDLVEGSTLFIPVWQPGAKLFTGDSHAQQGDGEVNLTALESAMREVRVRVELHEQPGWAWPFAETNSHWFCLGMARGLEDAFTIALRNTLDFLERRAGLSRLDAYSLASVGVSFRITQVVDGNKGVHAMIPKAIFSDEMRREIRIA